MNEFYEFIYICTHTYTYADRIIYIYIYIYIYITANKSSSLIEYPIDKALCHICSLNKAGNIHVCQKEINI